MPQYDLIAHRSWTLVIRPEHGEQWPLVQTYRDGPFFRPDVIRVELVARDDGGPPEQAVELAGFRLRRDGSPSMGRSSKNWDDIPDWALEVIDHAREAYGLSNAEFGAGL